MAEGSGHYGSAAGGAVREDESPVMDKSRLSEAMRKALAEMEAFLKERGGGVEPQAVIEATGFDKVKLLDQVVEAVLENDQTRARYEGVARGYKPGRAESAGCLVGGLLP